MNYDDIFYPMYLEFPFRKGSEFYQRHLPTVRKVFREASDNGVFKIKFTRAKSGAYCYSVQVLYKNKLIKNKVGYITEAHALMSIVDALRKNEFENFVV